MLQKPITILCLSLYLGLGTVLPAAAENWLFAAAACPPWKEVKDEVLAFYTETEPQNFTQATANGDWMTVRDFLDLMNQILGEEVILILEACHADFALEDFMANVHHGIGGRGEDWPGREAVIFSSHAEQVANFLPDSSAAAFTASFADALNSGQHDTLFESFEAARLHTHRQVRENCAEDTSRKELLQDWSTYKLMCTQMPTAWDPFGLLDDIRLETAKFGAL